jgi:hypothetical protein
VHRSRNEDFFDVSQVTFDHLLALVPVVAAAWLSRRSGLGLIAPWSRP